MENQNEQIAFNEELGFYMDVDSEEQYWLIEDICKILELTDLDLAVSELDPAQKIVAPVETHTNDSEVQDTTFIDHSGVLTLMMQSQAPIAKRFRRWVSREVMPAVLNPMGRMHWIDTAIKEELFENWLLPWWSCCDF